MYSSENIFRDTTINSMGIQSIWDSSHFVWGQHGVVMYLNHFHLFLCLFVCDLLSITSWPHSTKAAHWSFLKGMMVNLLGHKYSIFRELVSVLVKDSL